MIEISFGVWRSWLARAVWDREVEGSSPFTPTNLMIIRSIKIAEILVGYFIFLSYLLLYTVS